MVKTVVYKDEIFHLEMFIDQPPKLAHGNDSCGDPTFGDSEEEIIVHRNKENQIESLIIHNPTSDQPLCLFVDGTPVKLYIGCGMEFFRQGEHLSIIIDCFPL